MKKKLRILMDVVFGTVAACTTYAVVKAGTNDLLDGLSNKPVLKAVFYAVVIWMVWRGITIFFLWEDRMDARLRQDKALKEEQERQERDEFFRERTRVN